MRTTDGRRASDLFGLAPAVRHLNHGSFGAPLQVVLAEQERLRREAAERPVRWFSSLPDRVALARTRVAAACGLEEDHTAFVVNASAGVSAVLASLDLRPGADIVVTEHGYGAVVMGVERLARRTGGKVVVARVPLGADAAEACDAVTSAFTERTGLVVVDQITSATARELPVGDICRAARDRGIPSLVDGAHSPMLLNDPVEAADADYWVGNLHKFACASPGVAVLVARAGLGDGLHPVIDSWGAPYGFPQRFDHQGTADLTAWLTADLALAQIEEHLGWDRVRGYATRTAEAAQRVVAAAMTEVSGEPCHVEVTDPAAVMRLVALPWGLGGTHDGANELRARVLVDLDIEAAFTAFRGQGFVRLSAHAYNTRDDYLDFADRAVPYLVGLARQSRDR